MRRCRDGSASLTCGARAWFVDRDRSAPAAAFGSLSDFVLTGRSDLPRHTASPVSRSRGRRRRGESILSLGARIPRGVLRPRRPPPGECRLRRGDRQPAMGHDPRRPGTGKSKGRGCACRPIHPRFRASTARSRMDTPTAISCSWNGRWRCTRAGGRLGLVLPSGLATDHGSASLRRRLLSACDVDAMVGIDNRRGCSRFTAACGFSW